MMAREKLSMLSGIRVTRHMMRPKNLPILQSELTTPDLLPNALVEEVGKQEDQVGN